MAGYVRQTILHKAATTVQPRISNPRSKVLIVSALAGPLIVCNLQMTSSAIDVGGGVLPQGAGVAGA
jgi:hypothetical protein